MASVPFCMLRKTRHVPHHFFMFSCNLHWPMEYSVFTCQCTMQNYLRVLSHWGLSNFNDQVTKSPLPKIIAPCGNQTSFPEFCGSRTTVTPGLLASMVYDSWMRICFCTLGMKYYHVPEATSQISTSVSIVVPSSVPPAATTISLDPL